MGGGSHSACGKTVDERFYHPTGAESYYGRKKKFKGFLHFFYKVTGESREPPLKS